MCHESHQVRPFHSLLARAWCTQPHIWSGRHYVGPIRFSRENLL